VKQAGSLVAPNHLRFDFSHFTAVEDEELQDIEDIINKEVLRNQIVETVTDVPIDEAINTYHAMALFGEKYGDKVRVVRIGDFSTELCGGTHTGATGEIGLIKILKEGSVSSGVRRVEAITGLGSLQHFRKDHDLEEKLRSLIPQEIHGPSEPSLPHGAHEPIGSEIQIKLTVNGTDRGFATVPDNQTIAEFLATQGQRWGVRTFSAFAGDRKLQKSETSRALKGISKIEIVAQDARGAGDVLTFAPSFNEVVILEFEKKDSEIKRLTRELDSARMKSASSSTANISDQIKEVKGVRVLAHRVDNLERAQLRTLVDQLRDKIGSGVVVLGSASNGNVSLIVGVTKDLTGRVQAGKVIGAVAQKVGGKGGGRPDLAEAGGKDAAALDAALDGAYAVVESLLT
jgi:alanyl-tRNA synthetase